MSFLLAPKKELKKTSTPLHLSPIWESSNSDLQKPQILLCFGIAGRRDIFFYIQEGVDASFSSFLCAEEKDRMGLGYPQEESYLVSMQ